LDNCTQYAVYGLTVEVAALTKESHSPKHHATWPRLPKALTPKALLIGTRLSR